MIRGEIIRIDFFQKDGCWIIARFVEKDGVYLVRDRDLHDPTSEFNFSEASAWMLENGWHIREWPGGARAWKGQPRPIRSREAAAKLEREIRQGAGEELLEQLSGVDFRYDF